MTARLLAVAPLVAALLVYAGLAVPLGAKAGQARDAYGQARRARQQAREALAPLERREAAWRRAAVVAGGKDEGESAAALRRAVLAALEGSGATAVRLGVQAGPRGPTVRVSAMAPYAEAVRLSGELARPGLGLILARVQIQPRGDRRHVALAVEALAPRP